MLFRTWLSLLLPLSCTGCLVGPDFSSPAPPVAEKWLEAENPSVDTRNQEYRDWWTVFHDSVLNRLIEIAYNQNLTLVSAGTRVLASTRATGCSDRRVLPSAAAGQRLDHLYPAEPFRHDAISIGRHTKLLARLAWPHRQLGIGFLGQIPARHRIRGCRLSRLDRQLRLRLGQSAGRCRDDLYRHPHPANADPDRRGEYRQAKKGAGNCRGEIPRRHRDQARRLPGRKRPRANQIRRSRN